MGSTYLVYDERFERGPKFVASFDNVPQDWTTDQVMKNYGIANHLCVYLENFRMKNCVHHGSRFLNR